jgi:hypothetical protein
MVRLSRRKQRAIDIAFSPDAAGEIVVGLVIARRGDAVVLARSSYEPPASFIGHRPLPAAEAERPPDRMTDGTLELPRAEPVGLREQLRDGRDVLVIKAHIISRSW